MRPSGQPAANEQGSVSLALFMTLGFKISPEQLQAIAAQNHDTSTTIGPVEDWPPSVNLRCWIDYSHDRAPGERRLELLLPTPLVDPRPGEIFL